MKPTSSSLQSVLWLLPSRICRIPILQTSLQNYCSENGQPREDPVSEVSASFLSGLAAPLQPDLPTHLHVSLPIASTTTTRLVFLLDSNSVSTYRSDFVEWDARSPWYKSQHKCIASQLACNDSGRLWLGRSEVGRQGLLTCSRGKPRGSRDAR